MDKTIEELIEKAEKLQIIYKLEIRRVLESYYNKPYELECRIKSEECIIRKQKRFPDVYGENISKVHDILGFRISVLSIDDCPLVAKLIEKYLQPNLLLDYFETPKKTGFQAYLYYFSNEPVGVEIQIMTQQMRDWTNSTHSEHEMTKYGSVLSGNTQEERKL